MDVDNSNGVRARGFQRTSGGAVHFISIEAQRELSRAGKIAQIEERSATACAAVGLADETPIFQRIFVSDTMNQAEAVRGSALVRVTPDSPAVPVVQQAPLPGAKFALLAHHFADHLAVSKQRLSKHDVLVERNDQRQLWTTGLCAGENVAANSPSEQTLAAFGDLIGALASEGGTRRENCLRTWICLKDVDVFYQDMGESRGVVFAEHGLTGDTRFIASTGIEGARKLDYALCDVEALLRSGAASPADLMHFIVYLRDPTDFAAVEAHLAERFLNVPMIIVQGAVCRPEWLVEIEDIAITPNNAPELRWF